MAWRPLFRPIHPQRQEQCAQQPRAEQRFGHLSLNSRKTDSQKCGKTRTDTCHRGLGLMALGSVRTLARPNATQARRARLAALRHTERSPHQESGACSTSPGMWLAEYREDVTSDFLYLRLHGESELYTSGYTEEALDRWADRIRRRADGEEPGDARRIRRCPRACAPRATCTATSTTTRRCGHHSTHNGSCGSSGCPLADYGRIAPRLRRRAVHFPRRLGSKLLLDQIYDTTPIIPVLRDPPRSTS
jgi:hypothetical protein